MKFGTNLSLLPVLLILALIASACQSTVTPTSTPDTAATQASAPTAYPQPYPLETFNPYLAPVEPYPTADPALSAPLAPAAGSSLYPNAADGTEVMWVQAAAMIMNGEVAQVLQTHDLKVFLTLKDGRTLLSIEPKIDEVMLVIELCGEPCKEIIIATE